MVCRCWSGGEGFLPARTTIPAIPRVSRFRQDRRPIPGPRNAEIHWQTPFPRLFFGMITLLALVPMVVAAAGWSLLYLLCGGGLGGAILIFIVLKMFGK